MAKVDTWKKYVIEGKCELFEEWNAYTGVTKEDFLKGLDWLFEDTEPDKPRRELVCTQDGKLHHYRRVYYEDGSFNAFITFEGKGLRRTGLPQRCYRMNVKDPLYACTEKQKAAIREEAKQRKQANKIWDC